MMLLFHRWIFKVVAMLQKQQNPTHRKCTTMAEATVQITSSSLDLTNLEPVCLLQLQGEKTETEQKDRSLRCIVSACVSFLEVTFADVRTANQRLHSVMLP